MKVKEVVFSMSFSVYVRGFTLQSRVQKYHSKNTVDELPDSLAVWV